VLTSSQLVHMIIEAGREPVERDPLYNIISRGLENVSSQESLLVDNFANAGHNAYNLDIMSRAEVVTAAQKQIPNMSETLSNAR
jgi:hypothetical protein